MPDLTRYERFGWDYETWNPLDERALAWYRGLAGATGGSVLELACGTGRLLQALAEEGYEVVGLDLSPAMLALARDRVERLEEAVRGRIRLVHGDMRAFRLDETFRLAIIADNSLREIETKEGIVDALRCIARHLAPEGRVVVAERPFDPSAFEEGPRAWPWTDPAPAPEGRGTVSRKIAVGYDAARRRLHGEMTYRTTRPDGTVDDVVIAYDSLVLEVPEYLALFEEAGFLARVTAGYEMRRTEPFQQALCFVARRR